MNMRKEEWEELVAQVEQHGPEQVTFTFELDDENFFELEVNNISFRDNYIQVELL
jgi:hypothetical protein